MALAVKKQPQRDLASEIHKFRSEVDDFINSKVMELKRSPDGQSQPVEMLRHMLTRGDSCLCRAGLHLLEGSNG
jgi:hypothetical protein